MSLLARIFRPQASAARPSEFDDYWYQPVGLFSAAGINVSPESSIRSSAVYACCKVISESVGMLPLITYERTNDGGKERATDHPLYDVLRWEPNHLQTANEFWRLMIVVALLWGRAYAEIRPGVRGPVDQLIPLPPNRTRQKVDGGRVVYEVRDDQNNPRILMDDEVLVVPGLQLDVVQGLAIPEVARDVIGLALATEQYGARFFSQSSVPGGVLEYPGKLDEQEAKNLKQSWQESRSGLNNHHKVVVLENGMVYKQTVMSGEDAQMNETRQRQVEEVSRFFRVPLHKINDLSRATFGNIEEQSLEFITDTLMPWTTTIEQRIRKQLIINKQRFFSEFLLDDLLRGKASERAQVYRTYADIGVMSRNEIRVRENLNPLPGLDEPMRAANIGSVPNNTASISEASTPGRAAAVVDQMAGLLVRREVSAITQAAKRCATDQAAFSAWLDEFYTKHAERVAQDMAIDESDAVRWCEAQRADVLNFGVSVLEAWPESKPSALVELALGASVSA